MSIIEDIDRRLSAAVRSEREERGWSLSDLANRSNVSKAMISKIERGETKPTASLLVKISSAFGMTLARFFARVEHQQDRCSRRQDQPVWRDPENGYTRRQIIAVADHPIEITQVELPPNVRVAFAASSYVLLRQTIWVEQGILTITEAGLETRLEHGDCLAFGLPSDVELANNEPTICRYIIVTSRT
jgi:transcriptional regulator with XRE-family HTH domain